MQQNFATLSAFTQSFSIASHSHAYNLVLFATCFPRIPLNVSAFASLFFSQRLSDALPESMTCLNVFLAFRFYT
jgi:hypothetical protein